MSGACPELCLIYTSHTPAQTIGASGMSFTEKMAAVGEFDTCVLKLQDKRTGPSFSLCQVWASRSMCGSVARAKPQERSYACAKPDTDIASICATT